MKRLLTALFSLFLCYGAGAADLYPAANVEYVSGVAGLYGRMLQNNAPGNSGANMQYLLRTIDICNYGQTKYGESKYATPQAANTMVVDTAFATLLQDPPAFSMVYDTRLTGSSMTASFHTRFLGKFDIDWGDGTVDNIVSNNTSRITRSHTYVNAGEYEITIINKGITDAAAADYYGVIDYSSGRAGYKKIGKNDGTNTKIAALLPEHWKTGVTADGTPVDRSQMFYGTFYRCSGLTGEIPENLFAGISGAPAEEMFTETFENCTGLTGSIPENLFAGISGAPAEYMFWLTFANCPGLTGSIPENLFAGIQGAPAEYMFNSTFHNCSGLTGAIPNNLFAGISGAPAAYMFSGTFSGCSGLSDISHAFDGMELTSNTYSNKSFFSTFNNNSAATSATPKIMYNGQPQELWEIFPDVPENQTTFKGAASLSNYANIPAAWK